jgi:NADH pyrophosphatase NudC (nudix superfamily)
MEDTVQLLKHKHPSLTFCKGEKFYWSPETNEIYYDPKAPQPHGLWSLLHETGHALLQHAAYKTDYELLRLEMAAWEEAKHLAEIFQLTDIDEEHVQDCIDTYRDWLHHRSICPSCGTKSFQQSDLSRYRCFNCHAAWKVTPSRFSRTYRSILPSGQTITAFDS